MRLLYSSLIARLILALTVAALLISSPVKCGPAMLTYLRFTAEEGNILRGYCDTSSAPFPVGLAVIYQSKISKVLA
ncbi:hypothetical protein CUMW_286360 [Citrus unshiu]|uniref:Uncharacterized protein n=1 Tax=Citrus unshiu TaxID=55188 RepID=A0A2H5MUT6_CITUN|nr:hypothetical protein CUMW_286360 [Citrus unshiu]